MTIENLYKLFTECSGVTTDSRNCPTDSMFIALKGERFDGNGYAKKAIELGCKYAIVDDPEQANGENILLVEDGLKALQQLARHHRRELGLPLIAITGTNGKTTTKELTASVLASQYTLLATEGNLNNHIGVPLTLLKLKKTHRIGIIEMGASKQGDIKELVEIAEPNMGIITNIGIAHIEGFGSPEIVKQTKGELYDYIQKTDGLLFVNGADSILMEMSAPIKRIIYGAAPNTIAAGEIDHSKPTLTFTLRVGQTSQPVLTQLIGAYNLTNALAACAVGSYLNVAINNIKEALEAYQPNNMRSQYKRTEKNELIIDAYNANPTSMEAALRDFAQRSNSNKLVILGDMKELGEIAEEEHRRIASLLNELNIAEALLCGEVFSTTAPSTLRCFATTDELRRYIQNNNPTDKIILIKGSRSMKLESIVDLL
ncbi:UDP-N-acetylmuramoyl-tripeptide--D-alanyl-D-alanine ligase [Porphyromonadaceae bacterium]